MAVIYIDKKPYEAKEGENLLSTCLALGFDLPYFCWHPALHSVGACRQCAVKQFRDEHDTAGRIVMACMTPVEKGMRVSIDDPEARRFRAGVIEWMMTNHPHDCPVCDEGGECHLQDMTVMTGHSYRRYRGKKRTFRSQDLGPLLTHEMNRCIACYRCTRFYNDYAGGRDFGAFASRNRVFFGRSASGALESPFAGNLAEVCPTGVFDDKPFSRHYARPWDLQTAPSVCVHCGLGCNTIPGERYGALRRIRNRYNGEVNGYFLCDRGRYGYGFVNGDRRIREPRVRREKATDLYPASAEEAVRFIGETLASGQRAIGIGSPRASLEANFALRTLVGPDHFYAGIAEAERTCTALAVDLMQREGALIPTLSDIARCDAVLVLGEDISNTAPLLHLQVLQSQRQAAVEAAARFHIHPWDDTAVRVAAGGARGPLFIATTGATVLDGRATAAFRSPPTGIARTGLCIAHLIDPDAPPVADLGPSASNFASSVASALSAAKRPVVITGGGNRDATVIEAAANIATALRRAGKEAYLYLVVPECNSAGLALMTEKGLAEALSAAEGAGDAVAVVLENDLYRRMDAQGVERFFAAFKQVIAIDHTYHRTLLRSDAALPAATFAEGDGTFVNNEGRAQRAFRVFPARDAVRESWRWLKDVMACMGRPEAAAWTDLDALLACMAEALPVLGGARLAAPAASFRVAGMRVAREASRYSGRTAMDADRSVHEAMPPADLDAPFTFSMEGYQGVPPSALIPRFHAPGWNSPQAVNKFQQEIGGHLRGGDPGVRLFEAPKENPDNPYFGDVPAPFVPKDGLFLVVPFYHVFGSDELSVLTPEVRERVPRPYIALSERDMTRLRLVDGGAAVLTVGQSSFRLPVKVHPELPSGVAGLPCGVPDAPALDLPASAKVAKAAP
jgi:NADH-quinone oxidoreductase subunit G